MITKLPLGEDNRMFRIGFGKNMGKWFFRIDLWYAGYRFTEKKINKTQMKKILVFSTAWCGPCQQMKPSILKLQGEFKDKLPIEYVDADTDPERCVNFGVTSVPTIIFTENDQKVDVMRGVYPESQLRKKFEQFA